MSAVVIDQLTVLAGSATLVSKVSLRVEPGTWCTVIGPNGAGKTTLVETVAGLRRPSHGTVSVTGHVLQALNEQRRAKLISLVPQHPQVPGGMSVYDYVALGRTAHQGYMRGPNQRDRVQIESALARMSLTDFARRDVATLSGGERQRMVFGRALAQATPVMVLDEPTTGLDLRHQMELLELLKKEVRDAGLTVVATLHDLTLAGQFADRLVLLNRGEVVLDGGASDVVRSAALSECYGMQLRVVDIDGSDVVVPVRSRERDERP